MSNAPQYRFVKPATHIAYLADWKHQTTMTHYLCADHLPDVDFHNARKVGVLVTPITVEGRDVVRCETCEHAR